MRLRHTHAHTKYRIERESDSQVKEVLANLGMMKLKADRNLSKKCEKKERGMIKGPGRWVELMYDRVRPKKMKEWLTLGEHDGERRRRKDRKRGRGGRDKVKEVSDAEESERREGASEEKALKAKKRRGQEIKRAKGGGQERIKCIRVMYEKRGEEEIY